jgi:hypothetical protein
MHQRALSSPAASANHDVQHNIMIGYGLLCDLSLRFLSRQEATALLSEVKSLLTSPKTRELDHKTNNNPIEAYRLVGNELSNSSIYSLIAISYGQKHIDKNAFPYEIPFVPILTPSTKLATVRKQEQKAKSSEKWASDLGKASFACATCAALSKYAAMQAVNPVVFRAAENVHLLSMPLTAGVFLAFTLMMGECAMLRARRAALNRRIAKSDHARLMAGALVVTTVLRKAPARQLAAIKPAKLAL